MKKRICEISTILPDSVRFFDILVLEVMALHERELYRESGSMQFMHTLYRPPHLKGQIMFESHTAP